MRASYMEWSRGAAGRLVLRRLLLPGARGGKHRGSAAGRARWLFALAALGAFTLAQQEHGWRHTRSLLEAGAPGTVTLPGYKLHR